MLFKAAMEGGVFMLRSDAKAIILSWLDDANSSYFTDTNLNYWLNRAQKQTQMLLLQAGHDWYMQPVETSTVIDQCDYILPSDFVEEHRIEIVLSGSGSSENRQQLAKITTNEADLIALQKGVPSAYFIKKDRITILPYPDQVYTMRLYYSYLVADLTLDTQSFDVPEEFCEYVCLLGAYNGFIKDDRAPENLVAKKAEFEQLLKQMAIDRTTDSARHVVQTQNYDAANFFLGF